MHACTHIYRGLYACISIYIYIYIYMCVCVFRINIYPYACSQVCTHIYMIYIYIYIYIFALCAGRCIIGYTYTFNIARTRFHIIRFPANFVMPGRWSVVAHCASKRKAAGVPALALHCLRWLHVLSRFVRMHAVRNCSFRG